jgi:hypothetical protein
MKCGCEQNLTSRVGQDSSLIVPAAASLRARELEDYSEIEPGQGFISWVSNYRILP